METTQPSISLVVWRLDMEDKEWLSLHYRAYDHVDEANAVIKPFIEARKMINKKELDGYEASLTTLEQSAVTLVENHPRALQQWEALSFWKKCVNKRPERPSDEAVEIFKRITEKKAELQNRCANPLLDFQRADGEAVVKALIEQWTGKGFNVSKEERESNGEYDKTTLQLTWIQ